MASIEKMSELYRDLITAVGENVEREGLVKTPERAAKAMSYLTSGYEKSLEEVVNGAVFETSSDDMVLVKHIEFYSLCEHHLLPFFGKCHVAYVPNGKVLGLSKIARVVDIFARRLQIQEELTKQISQAIMDAVDAKGVAVVMEAKHMCMMMRGVERQHAVMTTQSMTGVFKTDLSLRAAFLRQAQSFQ
jgi:GTP cyclohydrolase IA